MKKKQEEKIISEKEPQTEMKLLPKENGAVDAAENTLYQEKNETTEAEKEKLMCAENQSKGTPRGNYARGIDFLMACLGFSIGLGNVWRFPYLCYRNGGGAFLIPYLICIVVAGYPAYFLEVVVGQFMQRGGMEAWKICPLFYGLGHCTTVIVFIVNLYYIVILTWSFMYLFMSFTSKLPWDSCQNSWNTDQCYLKSEADEAAINAGYLNGSAANITNVTSTLHSVTSAHVTGNMTSTVGGVVKGIDPTVEFWEHRVLGISGGIEDLGGVRWELALCLLLAWFVCYLCIFKGIKASGKVLYVVVPAPYVLMVILLIRGVTLPGAVEGIKYYLIPDWSKLLTAQVWVDAGTQILFSYSLGQGVLVALGSYNGFKHNVKRDAWIFAVANSLTSFFAGFVIFSVLGFMAHEQGVHISEVAEEGPGLAFIAYPKAIALMPVAPLWSILFFLMLILLGIDSEFVGIEGFVTAIVDMFPHQMRKKYRREIFLACQSLLSFAIGLLMVTNGGMYIFQLFDYYAGSRIILLIIFFEIVAAVYIFGLGRMIESMEMMFGFKSSPCLWYMKISWVFTAPAYCLVLFIQGVITYTELVYERPTVTYNYPSWAIAAGWCIALSSVLCVPAVMVYQILRARGTFLNRIRYLCRPMLRRDQLLPSEADLSKEKLSELGITLIQDNFTLCKLDNFDV